MSSVLFKKRITEYQVYPYTEDELDYIERVYEDLNRDIQLKNQTQPFLNDLTLKDMWDLSQQNFNIIFDRIRTDDEFKEYRSTLTRDNLNLALATLAGKLIYPDILAQNRNQEIDRVVSQALGSIYRWAEDNDGKPSNSGHFKMLEFEQMRLLEGMVHVQDDYSNGKFERELVPNSEVFIPNFWQPDIQKQPHVFRYKSRILYWEAERIFGKYENWKYVKPGAVDKWDYSQHRKFQTWNGGLNQEDEVSILFSWYDVPVSERKKADKPEKFFNALINGIPMFKADNKMPYKHGNYPIYNGIFFRPYPNYYWGISLPYLLSNDQATIDALKTILVNKEKLSLLPPMVAINGQHIEQDWIGFAKITSIDGDIRNLQKIPGVAEPVTSGDILFLDRMENSVRQQNPVSISPGQEIRASQPATTSLIQKGTAETIMQLYGLRAAFMVEHGAWLRLSNLLQFLPQEKVNKIVIPSATFADGGKADLEIVFRNPGSMSEEEEMQESAELMKEEEKSMGRGGEKRKMFIDPEYLENLDLYVSVSANPIERRSGELEKIIARQNYLEIYRNDPGFNQQNVRRDIVRKLGDSESELLVENPEMQAMAEGADQPTRQEQGRAMPTTALRELQATAQV